MLDGARNHIAACLDLGPKRSNIAICLDLSTTRLQAAIFLAYWNIVMDLHPSGPPPSHLERLILMKPIWKTNETPKERGKCMWGQGEIHIKLVQDPYDSPKSTPKGGNPKYGGSRYCDFLRLDPNRTNRLVLVADRNLILRLSLTWAQSV